MEIAHILSVQRLQRLQQLCAAAGSDSEAPSALLFVPGPDGRNNAGSNNAAKFLFLRSGGLEVQRDDGITGADALEEVVVLVTRRRVCLFYPDTAAALVAPVVELMDCALTWTANTNDVDAFQQAKVRAFKQMCLASLAEGEVVGVPVPLGYDEVQEVEQWPLIQSFALDNVVTSTGFFTLRYAVVDITYELRNVFRTVDGVAVARALISTVNETAAHIQQTINILTASHSCRARSLLTAKDIVMPLELLFESSAMQLNFTVDPVLAPRVLIGVQTSAIGDSPRRQNALPAGKICDLGVGGHHAAHLIIEASDPANGLRFCRTWFLAVGELSLPLRSSADDPLQPRPRSEFQDVAFRLRNLYTHLCLALRFAAYASLTGGHGDLKMAAQSIHAKITALMHKALQQSLGEQERLQDDESLSINIDCMDACGKVIDSREVEEIGGGCFLYIRAAINSVRVHGESIGSVAVGDTFAFHAYPVNADVEMPEATHMQFYPDEVCLTAEPAIPYIQLWAAAGAEEQTVHQTHIGLKDIHLLRDIGMGPVFEPVHSHPVEVLTSHPLFVHCVAQVRAYEGGFNLRHALGDSAPFPIVFSQHVSHVWTGMASDFDIDTSRRYDIFVLGLFFTPTGRQGFNATFPSIGKHADSGSSFLMLLVPTTGHLWESLMRYLDRWRVNWRKHEVQEVRNTFADIPDAERFRMSFRLWAKGCAPLTIRTEPSLEQIFLRTVGAGAKTGGTAARFGSTARSVNSVDTSRVLLKQYLPLSQFVGVESQDIHRRYDAATVMVCSLPGGGAHWIADQLIESARRQRLDREWTLIRLSDSDQLCNAETQMRNSLMNGMGVILATESVLDCPCHLASIANLGHLKSWLYVHNERVGDAENLPVQWAGWQRTCLDKRWCTHVLTMSKLKQLSPNLTAWKSQIRRANRELSFITVSSNVLDREVVEDILTAEGRAAPRPRLLSVATDTRLGPAERSPIPMLHACEGVIAERHDVDLGLFDVQFDLVVMLMSTLFKGAKSFTPATQKWGELPAIKPHHQPHGSNANDYKRGWERLVDAAVMKALFGATQQQMQTTFSLAFSDRARCEREILAIEGSILCGTSWVNIEADRHNILASASTQAPPPTAATLSIWATASPSARGLVHQVTQFIRRCQTPTLGHKSFLERNQVTPQLMDKLSAQNAERPCPAGWVFDGEAYVDFTGARTRRRPDMDRIVDEYVRQKNHNATKYNRLVDMYNGMILQTSPESL